MQESATQRLMLERGDIDVARNLNPEDIAGVRRANGVVVDDELRGRLMYMSMNQKHPELSKPKVRQALKYLIDYEGMQNSFLKGQYVIHQNFLPATYLGAVDENPFSLNIEKAKALLAEAGVWLADYAVYRGTCGPDRADHRAAGRHGCRLCWGLDGYHSDADNGYFLAFPRLVLALAFVAALGAGIENAVLAISLTAWPPYARMARAETMTIRSSDFISAIQLQGAGPLRIITKHIWPQPG